MACEEEHKYAIAGVTYDTAEEADEVLEEHGWTRLVAYHPGLIDEVIEDPEQTKTYCPEETQEREKAAEDNWGKVTVN